MSKGDMSLDPRGLIYEAYRMEIGASECRTIFLDWAIGFDGRAGPDEVAVLLARYGAEHPDHPMTRVLREGAERAAPAPRRRPAARRRRPPAP